MAQATQVLVSVQTLRGVGGYTASLISVEQAVAAYNKATPKAAHIVKAVRTLPNNTKGMQWQLALQATLARKHGATMVRLSVHGGEIALCGPKVAVQAAHDAMLPTYSTYSAAATAAYNPASHGNRVGFLNAYLCGMPAGLQVASKVDTALAYGLGYLYPFAAPSNVSAYALGQAAGAAMAAPQAAKPQREAKPSAAKSAPKVIAALIELGESAQAAAPQAATPQAAGGVN